MSRNVRHESGLLQEVPDLVEYPSVIAGTFAPDFLQLPDEVLTTTLIHHQHYFPVEDEHGKLKNAFLAVINTEPDNERTIARNAERVVTARLRDAQFFWEADRKVDARIADRPAGDAACFTRSSGPTRKRPSGSRRWRAGLPKRLLARADESRITPRQAARLSKADLTTDMVREFPELQGIMGGVYARDEGQPEDVWKAIYYHYLPIGVEADAPPTRAQLGKAQLTWACVSLADKLDTIVGLFAAGEKPTGSRDPFGLRRAAHGVLKILADLPSLPASPPRSDDRRPAGKSLRQLPWRAAELAKRRMVRHLRIHRRAPGNVFETPRLHLATTCGVPSQILEPPSRRVEAARGALQEPRFGRLEDWRAAQAREEHHEGVTLPSPRD